jgi:hypothetical protein
MSHDRSWHEIVFAAGADKDGPARFKYKELRYRITVGREAISREEMAVRPGRESLRRKKTRQRKVAH